LAVEGVVAVYEQRFFPLQGGVSGDLDGEGGFAGFRFAVDECKRGWVDSAVEVLVNATAACGDGCQS